MSGPPSQQMQTESEACGLLTGACGPHVTEVSNVPLMHCTPYVVVPGTESRMDASNFTSSSYADGRKRPTVEVCASARRAMLRMKRTYIDMVSAMSLNFTTDFLRQLEREGKDRCGMENYTNHLVRCTRRPASSQPLQSLQRCSSNGWDR